MKIKPAVVQNNNYTVDITANVITVGANVTINTTAISFGNSTVNTVISTSGITPSGTAYNVNANLVNANTADLIIGVNVGANVTANTTAFRVGNSTVNTVITAGNIALNGSQLTIGNTTVTTTLTGDILTVGNSTVNTVVNSTSIGVTNLRANDASGTADQLLYSNSTGGAYWRTPATITNVEPSTVGATSNGHVWYVYV